MLLLMETPSEDSRTVASPRRSMPVKAAAMLVSKSEVDAEAPVAVETADVMVAGVEDYLDALIREHTAERGHVVKGEGINQEYPAIGCGYLDEADALRVAEEAVGLEVEGDTGL